MKNYNKIYKCRLCRSSNLIKIIDFKKVPIGNNLYKQRKRSIKSAKYPLVLNQCIDCKHFQLGHTILPNILFKKNYTYLSGVSSIFLDHFEQYASSMKTFFNKKKIFKPKVLDVGSNDGSCLNKFKKQGFDILGVDPAPIPAKIANTKNLTTINNYFDKKTLTLIKKKYGLFDLVTSHNVLAHIKNIDDIFININEVLKKNGYLCFEVGYFLDVLSNDYFDTIYHEHLDYHHASPLINFLNSKGFSVISILRNSIQGGSLRILCQKNDKIINKRQVINFVKRENKFLQNKQKYINYWNIKILNKMNKFSKLIKSFKKNKKIIIGYGCPTKLILLLNIARLNSRHIDCIVEDNVLKHNKYLPSTSIPVIDNKILKNKKPDVIIIFAWNFADEIIKKIKNDFNKNISIVVPLPSLKIIKL